MDKLPVNIYFEEDERENIEVKMDIVDFVLLCNYGLKGDTECFRGILNGMKEMHDQQKIH